MYDTQTGERVSSGLPDGFGIDTAAFAQHGHLIVARTSRPPDLPTPTPGFIPINGITRPLDLVSYDLSTATCATLGHDIAPGLVRLPGQGAGLA